jgi:hypothetical protein
MNATAAMRLSHLRQSTVSVDFDRGLLSQLVCEAQAHWEDSHEYGFEGTTDGWSWSIVMPKPAKGTDQ